MNLVRTAMLIALMTALFMGVGYMIGGTGGMMIAFVVAAAMNLFSYWNSDKMVLRMHHAVEVDERTAPEFYRIVADLAHNAGLPMPKVYVIHNQQPNAFATGRNPENAAVAASVAAAFAAPGAAADSPASSAASGVAPAACKSRSALVCTASGRARRWGGSSANTSDGCTYTHSWAANRERLLTCHVLPSALCLRTPSEYWPGRPVGG